MQSDTPLVSLCIFTYNQEAYVEQAVKSALQQDYSALEVIISDDCSTDSTYEITKKIVAEYDGKHKVLVVQNTSNLGLVPHINNVFSKYVKGDYIILAAGDDISLPERVSNTVYYFNKYHSSGLLFPVIKIDSSGHEYEPRNLGITRIYKLSKEYFTNYSFMINGTGLAIKKQVISDFGLLSNDCPTEDSTFRFRCMLSDGIIYVAKPGILYRIHGHNMSSPSNIFSLKTDKIALQYKRDLQTAFEKKYIDIKSFRKFIIKIQWYKKNRRIAEQVQITNSIFLKCKLRLLNLYFKIKMHIVK